MRGCREWRSAAQHIVGAHPERATWPRPRCDVLLFLVRWHDGCAGAASAIRLFCCCLLEWVRRPQRWRRKHAPAGKHRRCTHRGPRQQQRRRRRCRFAPPALPLGANGVRAMPRDSYSRLHRFYIRIEVGQKGGQQRRRRARNPMPARICGSLPERGQVSSRQTSHQGAPGPPRAADSLLGQRLYRLGSNGSGQRSPGGRAVSRSTATPPPQCTALSPLCPCLIRTCALSCILARFSLCRKRGFVRRGGETKRA